MFCENRIVIAFDFLIAPCIPQIGLHADRLHIVCKFPDMIPQTAVLKVDASAVILFRIGKREFFSRLRQIEFVSYA